MYLKRTITTIVAVLILSIATANATIIIEPVPEPGSGGGGSGYPILIGTYLNQEINFNHFTMTGHASNWHSGNATFNGKLHLEDGFYDNSFLFADMKHGFYGDPYNARTVYTSIELSFYSHEGMYNMTKPFTDFETGTYLSFPGVDININSHILSANGTDQFPYLFSPYYKFDTHVWINDGTITAMNLDPSWNLEDGRLYTKFYLDINLTGNLSDIEILTSSLPDAPNYIIEAFAPVPEPATIALLGFGTISLLRRRNRH